MSLKCGIVGLPNIGKSTLFNALSKAKVSAENYPFCTIEPNTTVVKVPDVRLQKLATIVEPDKTVPTIIEFVDIAGLVSGASKGEGLGNKFLATIREVDTIVHVIRCFEDSNIIHVEGAINALRDKEIIDTELQLKDLDTIEKRLGKTQKLVKTGDKQARKEIDYLKKVQACLEKNQNIRTLEFSEEEAVFVKQLFLMTSKPIIYVLNIHEDLLKKDNEHTLKIKEAAKQEAALVLPICNVLEAEINSFDDPEEKITFLEDYGLESSGLDRLIRSAYELLGLITYFTAGKVEVRAWTVSANTKAAQAAGVIHTDFEKGFIKAEVIKYKDYLNYKSELALREAGKISIEGKNYTVKDGDIMHFKFR